MAVNSSKIRTTGGSLPNSPSQWIKISTVEGGPIEVEAQINPKELSFSKSAKYNMQQGKERNIPNAEFTGGDSISISVEMLFDFFEDGSDVREETNKLLKLAYIDESLHRPPKVKLEWGGEIFAGGFQGVVDSVKIRYTMFTSNGTPCRAVATVGMKQAKDVTIKSGNSPDVAKQRVIKRGESLQSIAASEYKDAAEWRRIADVNHIDDPLNVKPGEKLLIPPIL